MTQPDLFLVGNEDELSDLLLLLALASAHPLAGTSEGGDAHLGATETSPYDQEERTRVRLTAEDRYERECWEGDGAYASDVCVPRFGPI